MNRREWLITVGGAAAAGALPGTRLDAAEAAGSTDPAALARWRHKAESLTPELVETEQLPVSLVRAVPAPDAPLRFRMEREGPADGLASRQLKRGDSVIVDFEGHRTGFLSFHLATEGRAPDAPVRLRLVFGEVPTDVAEPFYPYKGQLSEAWLPDETINVDYLPRAVRMPRRYAFRYVKIEVIDTSPEFRIRVENLKAHAITSARTTPPPLKTHTPFLQRIDAVSVATLRDCMQTVFEDGPRRDQRLWIGDLRLQALTNYHTFRQNDVVLRCLYLFAALPREDGLVAACVFEKPVPRYGGLHIVDYAALFNVTLWDYVQATGDAETGRDLWPVAKRQLDILGRDIDAQGAYVDPGNMWIFIDWSEPLHKHAAIQAVLIVAYQATLATPAPFDRFLAGDDRALDPVQLAGLRAFIETGCAACHNGALLGGTQFTKFGVVKDYWLETGSKKPDAGRASFTKNEADRHFFRVPMLRNAARTAPYFHDGSVGTLEGAIKVMAAVQIGRTLDAKTAGEIAAFLESLSGPVPAHYAPPAR